MTTMLAFGSLGWPEFTFIFLIVLLLFGAKKLPEVTDPYDFDNLEFDEKTQGYVTGP